MAKELKFVMLLDCYGDLLTEHQQNVMELYYCEDLSLAEIAEPMGISRQAVRDIIKRTESVLLRYEESLGFAERLGKIRDCFDSIRSAASAVSDVQLKENIISKADEGLELL